MPNDTLAQAVARAMCGSPEPCSACMEEAHGVIAAIRNSGHAILTVESLSDPDAVHVNMLRGTIAKPTVAQIVHVYADEIVPAAELTEARAALTEARAALARQTALIQKIQEAERAVGRREGLTEAATLIRGAEE